MTQGCQKQVLMFPAPEAAGHGGLHRTDYQPLFVMSLAKQAPLTFQGGREVLCAQAAKGSPRSDEPGFTG